MGDGGWVRRELTSKEDLPGRFLGGVHLARGYGATGGSTRLAHGINHMCYLFQISGGGE